MKQKSTGAGNTTPAVPMTAEQRAAFDRDGYLIIRGALGPDEVAAAREALDRVYAAAARAGALGPDGSMHRLSAAANCPQVASLTDHPAAFGYVWSVLGWNIHIYHSHLDVHPPIRVPLPFRFDWHQDGGVLRPPDLACPFTQPLRAHPQGGVLRLHLPVDRHP